MYPQHSITGLLGSHRGAHDQNTQARERQWVDGGRPSVTRSWARLEANLYCLHVGIPYGRGRERERAQRGMDVGKAKRCVQSFVCDLRNRLPYIGCSRYLR